MLKFNHKYSKLRMPNGKFCEQAMILGVFKVKYEHLSKEFIMYDSDDGLTPIPESGDCILLICMQYDELGMSGNIFTTLRRYDSERIGKYYAWVGDIIKIIYKQEATSEDKKV